MRVVSARSIAQRSSSVACAWKGRGERGNRSAMIPASQDIFARLNKAWHERALALKALSFGLVGLVNSAVDFGVFSFAYYYLGLPIVAANTMAWVIAVTVSYVLNSTITFAAESGRQLGV